MNDELKISIVADADVSGYQKASAAQDDLTKGTTNYADSNKKAGDSIDDVTAKNRAQFLIFEQINRIMPGLGLIIHEAFTGPIAPILIMTTAIGAIRQLKRHHKQDDSIS